MEHRAQFDAVVSFSNGGMLRVEGFRVDVPANATHDEVAELFVRSLGLLMVQHVSLTALVMLDEPHKGTRGGPSDLGADAGTGAGRGGDLQTHLVDLSHPVEADMITYPGLPGPQITPHLTREASRAHYAPGTEFAIDRISMLGNTGTYLDSPYHRYDGAPDLAALPLERLAGLPAVVVRTAGSPQRAVDAPVLAPFDVAGRAVLLHTGWAAHWRTDSYGVDAPFLTAAGAHRLVEHGASLVGIDSVNIDDMTDPVRPAHSILLRAGIPVVEHLRALDRLPVHGARFTAVPPAVVGFGTFPVRAFASVPER